MDTSFTQCLPSLTLAGAEQLITLAVAEATRENASICIAVVDSAGHLLAFRRMDGAVLISIDVAIGKAITAVFFGKPSSVFEQIIDKGKTSMLAVSGTVPLAGGQPVNVGGTIVGAIGISGLPNDGDEIIAVSVISKFEGLTT